MRLEASKNPRKRMTESSVNCVAFWLPSDAFLKKCFKRFFFVCKLKGSLYTISDVLERKRRSCVPLTPWPLNLIKYIYDVTFQQVITKRNSFRPIEIKYLSVKFKSYKTRCMIMLKTTDFNRDSITLFHQDQYKTFLFSQSYVALDAMIVNFKHFITFHTAGFFYYVHIVSLPLYFCIGCGKYFNEIFTFSAI